MQAQAVIASNRPLSTAAPPLRVAMFAQADAVCSAPSHYQCQSVPKAELEAPITPASLLSVAFHQTRNGAIFSNLIDGRPDFHMSILPNDSIYTWNLIHKKFDIN
ncbi:hypothetical protein PoB_000632200 [Plakobranchus ocellatus]|uniref:Uncharacterized protein n=1 Tax=Plakobranchus ocellatus TaxID=259542 RepID=A0AAV3YAH4_9GAST|nr:hypothetical protein PoB_000632200 [Plakobranchus ocellatus]